MIPEHLAQLLNEVLSSYPELASFSLKNHALNDSNYQQIADFIKAAPKLMALDISENFFGMTSVYNLHATVALIYTESQNKRSIQLTSDFTLWSYTHYYPEKYMFTKWAFSPKRWEKESEGIDIFHSLTHLLIENPESIIHFLDEFKPEYKQKNRYGWLPIVGSLTSRYPYIAIALIKQFGIEDYTERLIQACTDPSMITLDTENLAIFIHNVYLFHSKNINLALKVLNAILPNDCGARSETFGRIAFFEKDFKTAYEYFLKGAEQGSSGCFPILSNMLMDENLRELIPYDREKLKYYLKESSERGYIAETIQYALILEEDQELGQAFRQLKAAEQMLNDRPNDAPLIPSHLKIALNIRLGFAIGIEGFEDRIFSTRAELVQERMSKQSSTLLAFDHVRFIETLEESLGEPAIRKLMGVHGKLLLQLYAKDTHAIEQIQTHVCNKIRHSTEVNRGLLSMRAEEFSQALVDEVSQYLKDHPLLGIKMQTYTAIEPPKPI